jgi:hypothetical protein
MTTSRQAHFLSEIAAGDPIPPGKLAYFQERTRNNLYNFVISRFLEREQTEGLTRAQLARRIGRTPDVISRLLGAPGNWTIATISDLLLGIGAEELEPESQSVLGRTARNTRTLDHLDEDSAPTSTGTAANETKVTFKLVA